jgi:hypothetical protein
MPIPLSCHALPPVQCRTLLHGVEVSRLITDNSAGTDVSLPLILMALAAVVFRMGTNP